MKRLKWIEAILLVFMIVSCCAVIATDDNTAVKNIEKTTQKVVTNTPVEEHLDVDWNVGCQECHAEETPDIFAEWKDSRHGTVGFGCYICHGDGEETFAATGSVDGCQGCHDGYEEKCGVESKDKSCFSCHNGHTLALYERKGGTK
jgi:hypothetical protein